LPYYNLYDWLEFSVDGNRVTLKGGTRPSLKSDAENAVKGIEGVESVQNNIEVLPPSPDDDRTAQFHDGVFSDVVSSTGRAIPPKGSVLILH